MKDVNVRMNKVHGAIIEALDTASDNLVEMALVVNRNAIEKMAGGIIDNLVGAGTAFFGTVTAATYAALAGKAATSLSLFTATLKALALGTSVFLGPIVLVGLFAAGCAIYRSKVKKELLEKSEDELRAILSSLKSVNVLRGRFQEMAKTVIESKSPVHRTNYNITLIWDEFKDVFQTISQLKHKGCKFEGKSIAKDLATAMRDALLAVKEEIPEPIDDDNKVIASMCYWNLCKGDTEQVADYLEHCYESSINLEITRLNKIIAAYE